MRTASLALCLVAAAAALACGARAPARGAEPAPSALPPLPPSPKPADLPLASAEGLDNGLADDGDDGIAPPDRPLQDQALAAAKAGRLYEAKRLFARLVLGYPESARLAGKYHAVVSQIATAQRASKAALEARELRTLGVPPSKYTLTRPAQPADRTVPKLVKSSEKRNEITDDEAWFKANGPSRELWVPPARDVLFAPGAISSTAVASSLANFVYVEYTPSARFAEGTLPLEVPLAYGTRPLTRAIDSAPYFVAIYGAEIVAVFDHGAVRALLDLAAFQHPVESKKGAFAIGQATLTTAAGTQRAAITVPTESITHELFFALASGGTLYVEHTNLEYAKESRGINAFVSAIDMDSGDLLWRSQPLVANGRDFVLVGSAVVCGYGFTAEPDFVFVLDGATGAVKQKVPVKSGPEHFVLRDGTLRVRTYDTDYVFAIK